MTTGFPAVKTVKYMYACVSILHVNERQLRSRSQTCPVQWAGNHGSTSYVVCTVCIPEAAKAGIIYLAEFSVKHPCLNVQ